MDDHSGYVRIECDTATAFWETLSPTRPLFREPHKLLYRGQANGHWSLVPVVLREPHRARAGFWGSTPTADMQVHYEARLLQVFAEHCDRSGVRIPNDSIEFRNMHVSQQRRDRYYIRPSDWPNPDLVELMALAQHHGVPTRLLDWTRRSHVAAFFAAQSAIARHREWSDGERMAVWALNAESINVYRENLRLVQPPGSVSPNLAAQQGVFTLQSAGGKRGCELIVSGLESLFAEAPEPPLCKVTLPVDEASALLDLCDAAGINAAALFPGPDGAARATIDDAVRWAFNERDQS